MTELGVNIDHVATLRQARGTDYPDPVLAAQLAEEAGAFGITVHLREDRRHIQDRDVERLRESITTRMNLELAPVEEIVSIACRIRPDEVCIVPERRAELTTEGGLDVVTHRSSVENATRRLQEAGIEVSLFIDPVADQIRMSREIGADLIELHTGKYAELEGVPREEELQRLLDSSHLARELGLKLNAGHGLHIGNVVPIARIEGMGVLNIGHSIVSRALFLGFRAAVREMIDLIKGTP